ncbi:hypothetical protein BAUCODRAFT_36198 [Baudoinia panamericana UAMH 10762]|uniref:Uncharacterized protein n=1 Tax=Baudoinia panamericana (strain UAMH 10762) TaxID=717646 RepID=M2LHT8_BAUPA|nr:uncharacterized protein BAUCODRAFT_36198 [Baudoinia panamericana UAMH 10762]EMC93742.1 hypothetical protein BAUCODRAFT_36198 [Baudoinia panamericana UAMH 10762]
MTPTSWPTSGVYWGCIPVCSRAPLRLPRVCQARSLGSPEAEHIGTHPLSFHPLPPSSPCRHKVRLSRCDAECSAKRSPAPR